jgi:phage shock protein PspC (stress-responsive transcriptional regulator)
VADTLVFTLLGIDKLGDVFDTNGKKADDLADKLDKFGTTGSKALAGFAAASLAGGVAVGGALAGLTSVVIGAGVALVSNNAAVGESFTKLSDDALAMARTAAAPLASVTTQAIASVRTMVGQAQPLLASMFSSATPQLLTLTTGINRLALNALPGMAVAVKESGAAMKGAADFMASAGQGVGTFFERISHGSDSGGVALASFGRIVNTVLPAAGGLLVQLADAYASNAGKIESAITNVSGIITSFSGGAMPVLSGAVRVGLDVLNGLANVLGPVADELGGLVGYALAAGAAIKLVSTVTGGLTSGVAIVQQWGAAFRAAQVGSTGFASRIGGLVGMMGGPLGLAITGVVAGLAILGATEQSTAEATAQHTSYVEALTTSLRESANVIDFTTRKTVAADDSVKDASKSAEKFGISSAQVVDAVLGQGHAMDDLKSRLAGVISANTEYSASSDYVSQNGGPRQIASLNDTGVAAKKLLDDLLGLNGGTKEAQDAAAKYGAALASANASMLASTSSGHTLAAAVVVLKDAAASAEDKVKAFKDALDALNGDQLNLQEATAKVNASLLQLGDLASSSTDHTKGWGDALIGANGAIDTMLPNGQQLFGILNGLRDSSAALAERTYEMARQQGDDVPTAMGKAQASMARSRDEMLKLTDGLNISRGAAEGLAKQFDLNPDVVQTIISTPGLTDAQRELLILRSRVEEVPGAKSITVQSLSDEARKKLEDLGYTVKTLPDGRVQVSANTDPAWTGLNAITSSKPSVTVTVYYNSVGNPVNPIRGQSTPLVNAIGRIVVPMAAGGFTADAIDGGLAQFVPKNREVMVGDRKDVSELFAPLDHSVRSRNLIRAGARMEGIDLGGGGGGVAVAQHTYNDHRVIHASFPNVTDASEIQKALLNLKRDQGGAPLGLD